MLSDGIRWHLQVMGEGPVALLVHGTGASTHSWRDLAPMLARSFTVVAPDLPGHGFTEPATDPLHGIPGVAAGLGRLLRQVGVGPVQIGVGHSAGAPVLVEMALDGWMEPRALVSFAGAFFPFLGVADRLMSAAAKVMARSFLPRWVAWRARDPDMIEGQLRATGSRLDPEGIRLYQRLVRRPGHVAAALQMMAHWELVPLVRRMDGLEVPVWLVSGENDRAVPASEARRIARRLRHGTVLDMPECGHLAHEERPEAACRIVLDAARAAGLRVG